MDVDGVGDIGGREKGLGGVEAAAGWADGWDPPPGDGKPKKKSKKNESQQQNEWENSNNLWSAPGGGGWGGEEMDEDDGLTGGGDQSWAAWKAEAQNDPGWGATGGWDGGGGTWGDAIENDHKVRFAQGGGGAAAWGVGNQSYTSMSHTMSMAQGSHGLPVGAMHKGAAARNSHMPPQPAVENVKCLESGGMAFGPVTNAFFNTNRPAKDRFHWMFPPDKDDHVALTMAAIQGATYGLGALGLTKFLETHHPNQPVFDWLNFDALQNTMDKTLQESVAFYDPAQIVIVFVYLPSHTGNSVAIWRRKIPVPGNVRRMYQQQIDMTKKGLRQPKDYVVFVEELPPKRKTGPKRQSKAPTHDQTPSIANPRGKLLTKQLQAQLHAQQWPGTVPTEKEGKAILQSKAKESKAKDSKLKEHQLLFVFLDSPPPPVGSARLEHSSESSPLTECDTPGKPVSYCVQVQPDVDLSGPQTTRRAETGGDSASVFKADGSEIATAFALPIVPTIRHRSVLDVITPPSVLSTPMSLSPESLHKLIEAINANAVVNYAMVDFIEMLPREIEYMWYTQLTVPKTLFFILRYYVFVHMGLSGNYHGNKGNAGKDCIPAFYGDGSISYARLYAFAGRQKSLLIFLSVLFVALTIVEFWLLAMFSKTVEFAELPSALGIGCIPIKANNIWLSIIFKLILFSLATVTFIMMYIAYKRRSNAHGMRGLLRVFYRDGVFYFITLSVLAVSNIIFDHVAPANGMQFTMVQIQVYLNALLTTRMLIHLRECTQKDYRLSSFNGQPRKGRSTAFAELEWSAIDEPSNMSDARVIGRANILIPVAVVPVAATLPPIQVVSSLYPTSSCIPPQIQLVHNCTALNSQLMMAKRHVFLHPPKAHDIFSNHDLLLIIFSNVQHADLTAANREERVQGRKELRNLAAVCKSFKDPALDLLWSCLDCLLPLIKVLPNLKVIDNAFYCHDAIAPDSKFRRYASKVRVLDLQPVGPGTPSVPAVSPHLYSLVAKELSGDALFPNLKKLAVHTSSNPSNDFMALSTILSATIPTVAFFGDGIASPLFTDHCFPLAARQLRGSLKHLVLRNRNKSTAPSVLDSILQIINLESLDLQLSESNSISPSLLFKMGQSLKKLTSLTLDMHFPSHRFASAQESSEGLFPKLKVFYTTSRSRNQLCECIPPFLRTKTTRLALAVSEHISSTDYFKGLAETLTNITSLKVIDIIDADGCTCNLANPSALNPLLKLPLVELRVKLVNATWSSSDTLVSLSNTAFPLLQLTTRPTLRSLTLPPKGSGYIPTLACLSHIAEKGILLEELLLGMQSVSNNGTWAQKAFPTIQSLLMRWRISSTPKSQLRHLAICEQKSLTQFSAEQYNDIAQLLDLMFPRLVSVTPYCELTEPQRIGKTTGGLSSTSARCTKSSDCFAGRMSGS
ncbi:hypothetical protein NMY22_g15693 [Coprinellus aureogranulatus]|nr:hypothetical protein NMY22_g15693 [Coprinellus aureogranulatus]